MTTPSQLTAKFVKAFDVKTEEPTDAYINDIFESLGQLLYFVEYDEVNTTHNLIGMTKTMPRPAPNTERQSCARRAQRYSMLRSSQ